MSIMAMHEGCDNTTQEVKRSIEELVHLIISSVFDCMPRLRHSLLNITKLSVSN